MTRDISMIGIIGNPISQSISPSMHNEWIQKLKLQAFYTPLFIANHEDLSQCLQALPKLGFVGINITIPYKELVLKYLKHYNAVISEDAEKIGAVNTIKWSENGTIYGFNTDHYGFSKSLYDTFGTINKGSNVLVIGAGGASRSVIYSLLNLGHKVTICNRTIEKASNLADHFKCSYLSTQPENITTLHEYDLIVNTTSAGTTTDKIQLDLSKAKNNFYACDIVYSKNEELTPFLKLASSKTKYLMDGKKMLINQGAKSFEIWFGINPIN